MSRIGKKSIEIPTDVTLERKGNTLIIKGKYGSLEQSVEDFLSISIENQKLSIGRTEETILARQRHGLTRALLQNMIVGVSQKFSKILVAEGVGYKFQVEKKTLVLNVGFSHPVKFEIPADLEVKGESQVKISITGISKEKVGLFADKIRAIKPPEPYKGKGIFYQGEVIRRKAGKTGK